MEFEKCAIMSGFHRPDHIIIRSTNSGFTIFRVGDCFIRVTVCSNWVGDWSIRVYLSVVYNFWVTIQVKLVLLMQLLKKYFPILFTIYYSWNCAGILDMCLLARMLILSTTVSSNILKRLNITQVIHFLLSLCKRSLVLRLGFWYCEFLPAGSN